MNRVKIKKDKKIMISGKELDRYMRGAAERATGKVMLLMLAATCDELELDENKMCDIATRVMRYSQHMDKHVVRLEDLRKTIEKKTGVKIEGGC